MSGSLYGRFRSVMLGPAACDALGAAVEFRSPGTLEPVTGRKAGSLHGFPAVYWADDTSMALCLAESIVKFHAFDPISQLHRYINWCRHHSRVRFWRPQRRRDTCFPRCWFMGMEAVSVS
jgi:ADP-ribosylglycohydrolase